MTEQEMSNSLGRIFGETNCKAMTGLNWLRIVLNIGD